MRRLPNGLKVHPCLYLEGDSSGKVDLFVLHGWWLSRSGVVVCAEVFPLQMEGVRLLVNKGLSNHFQVSDT